LVSKIEKIYSFDVNYSWNLTNILSKLPDNDNNHILQADEKS